MKLKLTNVRLSFPDLFSAVQFQGQGPFSYGATFLVAYSDPQKAKIDAAIKEVATEKWNKKAEAYLEDILLDKKSCCWIDGKRKPDLDGYEGHFALTAKRAETKGAPLVLDTNKSPLTARSGKPYSGCYVNVALDIYAQDNDKGKAMRCELLGVQFARDGESFGGGAAPSADDFDELSVGADAEELV